MAGLDREAIYADILARLTAGVTGLAASPSRRFRDLEDVTAAEQPALFLVVDRETPQYEANKPLRWLLHLGIFLYARTDDVASAPATPLAQYVRQIEAALQWQAGDGFPAPGTATTLGGKAFHVALGEVGYGEGARSGQGVVFIPLEVLAVTPT